MAITHHSAAAAGQDPEVKNHSLFSSFSQAKRSGGNLELQRRRAKLASGNKEISGDGGADPVFVCFGDTICLDHKSGLRMAVDIWDELLPGQGVFSATGVPPRGGRSSTGPAPAARSTFVIEPLPRNFM